MTRFLLAALAVTALGACTTVNCTLIGCADIVDLTLERSAWADGEYLIEASFGDGPVTSCEFTVPLTGDAFCGFEEVDLSGGTLSVQLPISGDDAGFDEVDLVIEQDGAVVYEGSASVAWGDPSYPNGEQCGPECISGEAVAQVD